MSGCASLAGGTGCRLLVLVFNFMFYFFMTIYIYNTYLLPTFPPPPPSPYPTQSPPMLCRHHPSDVIAGAFLGTLFGLLYAVRATARVDGVAAGVGAMGGGDVATPDPSCLLLRSSRQPDRSDAATL